MADTKILRQKLLTEMARIRKELEALDLVEAMSTRLGVNGASVAARKAVATKAARRSPGAPRSAADIMKELAQKNPNRQWTTRSMDEEIRQAGHRSINRSNVGVTFKRLTEDGLFEIVSRNTKLGATYRWTGGSRTL